MSAGGKIRAALGALATGPKLQRQFEKPDHLHESGRLSEEDVSAKFIGAFDVQFMGGVGEDDRGRGAEDGGGSFAAGGCVELWDGGVAAVAAEGGEAWGRGEAGGG